MRDVDTLILTLGAYQRMKLAENEHKPDWLDEDYGQLLLNLECERREFIVELGNPDATPESVWREGADLANFAAMICQHFAKRYTEKLPLTGEFHENR